MAKDLSSLSHNALADMITDMITDMTLTKGRGYYELSPNTDAGRAFVQLVRDARSPYVGTDFKGRNVLLDGFFAFAGDWCRDHVLPRGLSLRWGESTYAGEEGMAALFEECA